MRVPQADGTLVALPVGRDDALMPSLLTLSDVMGTGHHAALAARVAPGKTVAVVGGNEVVNPFVVTEVYVRQGDGWKLGSLSFTRLLGQ